MKDFTYSIIGKTANGESREFNCSNSITKFNRQSRFKTEAAARKGLERDLRICKLYRVEVTGWTLYSETMGTIETSAQ